MEYFKLLHLSREPFSNSPDPFFFFGSEQHMGCIQKLEIALRLRRGLNVVTGDVGAGKTTLCRQLLQTLSNDPEISPSLILDPDFSEPALFLSAIVHLITGIAPDLGVPVSAMKESLKQYLFEKGVEEEKTVVLIVDEGQKLTPATLEIFRELLNYETNDHKLLQILIFAQTEFAETLRRIPNLADRVNLYLHLSPLNFRDSIALIRHRISLAADPEAPGGVPFSKPALWRIYRLSGGYPRKIIHLCHQCLLAMIIQNRSVAGWRLVGACAGRTLANKPSRFKPATATAALLLLCICFGIWLYSDSLREFAAAHRDHGTNAAPKIPSVSDAVQPSTAGSDQGKAPIPIPETATASSPPSNVSMPQMNTPSSTGGSSDGGRSSLPEEAKQQSPSAGSPSVLGDVPVAVGDTLEGLVRRVYGGYSYRYHQAVLAENPQLTDPDRLTVGERIAFPALASDTTRLPEATWWISMGKEADLGSAVSRLREETDGRFPLRILSLRDPMDRLTFQVVLKTCFEDPASAELEKNRMASRASVPMEIICLGKNSFRFFGSLKGIVPNNIANDHRTSNIEERQTDEH